MAAFSVMLVLVVCLLGSGGVRAEDAEWPRRITRPEATILMYQPQPERFRGNILTARAAVAVTLKGTTSPVYGTVWFSSRVETDREQRTVRIADFAVTRATLPATS